jgi:hypothetical protein
MCVSIFWKFQVCGHRVLQNTCPCHIPRRKAPGDDLLLDRPVLLPHQGRIPTALFNCKKKSATKPMPGLCGGCLEAKAKGKGGEGTSRERSLPTTPQSSLKTGKGKYAEIALRGKPVLPWGSRKLETTARRLTLFGCADSSVSETIVFGQTPSPDSNALQAVKNSFFTLAMIQETTPDEK